MKLTKLLALLFGFWCALFSLMLIIHVFFWEMGSQSALKRAMMPIFQRFTTQFSDRLTPSIEAILPLLMKNQSASVGYEALKRMTAITPYLVGCQLKWLEGDMIFQTGLHAIPSESSEYFIQTTSFIRDKSEPVAQLTLIFSFEPLEADYLIHFKLLLMASGLIFGMLGGAFLLGVGFYQPRRHTTLFLDKMAQMRLSRLPPPRFSFLKTHEIQRLIFLSTESARLCESLHALIQSTHLSRATHPDPALQYAHDMLLARLEALLEGDVSCAPAQPAFPAFLWIKRYTRSFPFWMLCSITMVLYGVYCATGAFNVKEQHEKERDFAVMWMMLEASLELVLQSQLDQGEGEAFSSVYPKTGEQWGKSRNGRWTGWIIEEDHQDIQFFLATQMPAVSGVSKVASLSITEALARLQKPLHTQSLALFNEEGVFLFSNTLEKEAVFRQVSLELRKKEHFSSFESDKTHFILFPIRNPVGRTIAYVVLDVPIMSFSLAWSVIFLLNGMGFLISFVVFYFQVSRQKNDPLPDEPYALALLPDLTTQARMIQARVFQQKKIDPSLNISPERESTLAPLFDVVFDAARDATLHVETAEAVLAKKGHLQHQILAWYELSQERLHHAQIEAAFSQLFPPSLKLHAEIVVDEFHLKSQQSGQYFFDIRLVSDQHLMFLMASLPLSGLDSLLAAHVLKLHFHRLSSDTPLVDFFQHSEAFCFLSDHPSATRPKVSVVKLNLETQSLEWGNRGLKSPICLRASGSIFPLISSAKKTETCCFGQTHFHPGDALFLYNAVAEQSSALFPYSPFYHEEHLMNLLANWSLEPVKSMVSHLEKELLLHLDSPYPPKDLGGLIFRYSRYVA